MESSSLKLTFQGFLESFPLMERMKARVEREYERGEWNELDRRVWEHSYSMRDLSQWPFDAVSVFTEGESCYYLGSLKSACSLESFPDRFGHGVDVVVSCCAEELRAMTGGPTNWRLYFLSQGVKSLQFAMRDLTVRSRDDAAGVPFRVLFHCFGGINRSTGTLAAWLVIGHNYTAEEAVDAILRVRPSLRPWCDRDYVLWVLGSLEVQRQTVQTQVYALARDVQVDRVSYWMPPASVV
ncbi:unnamed protein product [Symbiodinium sp. CCMP2592]|nr:unnamed protein product [Symbiodinium sp. CCMP2592]